MSEITDISGKQVSSKMGNQRTLKGVIRREWQLIVKVLELIFSVLCVGLVMEPAKRGDLARIHLDHFALIFATFNGYILITLVFIVARIIGDKIPYRTGFIFSVLASGLFFASGILLATDRKRRYFFDDTFFEPRPQLLNLLAASTAFSFFSAVLFAVEAAYIWKFREDF